MVNAPVPGTDRCWRIPPRYDDLGPYTAVCACGWTQPGAESRRRAKAWWHRHVDLVREMKRQRVTR